MHERLKVNHEHVLTINTMREAMKNLNDYVFTLKKEISRLRSIKGLNTNARIFSPLKQGISQVKSRTISAEPLKEQQITILSEDTKASVRQEQDGVINRL